MIVIGMVGLLLLAYLALVAAAIFSILAKIAADISSIQDYCSREHAKVVAEDMKKKGYVITEAGKELLKANTGK